MRGSLGRTIFERRDASDGVETTGGQCVGTIHLRCSPLHTERSKDVAHGTDKIVDVDFDGSSSSSEAICQGEYHRWIAAHWFIRARPPPIVLTDHLSTRLANTSCHTALAPSPPHHHAARNRRNRLRRLKSTHVRHDRPAARTKSIVSSTANSTRPSSAASHTARASTLHSTSHGNILIQQNKIS